jgi:ribosome-associated protein
MENEIEYTSRTKKKKEAEDLQRLGLELTQLSVPQLERIEIPENLRTALIEGKNITSNIAGRRHRQFIGALMRDVDPESIRLALLQAKDEIPGEFKTANEAGMWIDRLLTGDRPQMEILLCKFPGLERQRLGQLVRNIKKEKPGTKISKSRRALEQLIIKEIN